MPTPAGQFDSLAVPIESRGEVLGVFVVGYFRDAMEAEANSTVLLAGQVAAGASSRTC